MDPRGQGILPGERHEGPQPRGELVVLDDCGDVHVPGETYAVALARRQAPVGFRILDALLSQDGLEFLSQHLRIRIVKEAVADGLEDLLPYLWG